jgi:hypothetical protein
MRSGRSLRESQSQTGTQHDQKNIAKLRRHLLPARIPHRSSREGDDRVLVDQVVPHDDGFAARADTDR